MEKTFEVDFTQLGFLLQKLLLVEGDGIGVTVTVSVTHNDPVLQERISEVVNWVHNSRWTKPRPWRPGEENPP